MPEANTAEPAPHQAEKSWWVSPPGWLSFCIACLMLSCPIATLIVESFPFANVQVYGRMQQGFVAPASFELEVYHQHPGDLHRGKLTVDIRGSGLARRSSRSEYSFETWSPNESNARRYSSPLGEYNPNDPITVVITVQAAEVRNTSVTLQWENGKWKK